jgi:flagellar hook-length control protein FliK
MATVPNMKISPTIHGGGAPAGGEGTAGDLFAQLMSMMPEVQPETAQPGVEGQAEAEATETGADQPAGDPTALAVALPLNPPVLIPAATDIAQSTAPTGEAPLEGKGNVTAQPTAQPTAHAISANVFPAGAAQPGIAPGLQTSLGSATFTSPSPAKPPEATAEGAAESAELLPTQIRIAAALKTFFSRTGQPERVARGGKASASEIMATGPAPIEAIKAPVEKPAAAGPVCITAQALPVAPLANPVFSIFTETASPQTLAQELPQPIENPEQMIERELDLAQDGEWLDQLARDITRSAGSEGPMRFRLNPETLGHLKVEIAQTDNGSAIRLTADTEAARAIIADAQPRLLAEARAQGLRITETLVDVETSSGQLAGDQRRQEEAREEPRFRTSGSGRPSDQPTEERPGAGSDRYA